jgi:hypothetical protein
MPSADLTIPSEPSLLSDLTHHYLKRTPAVVGAALIDDRKNAKRLKRLLRHHDEGLVSNEDTYRRDAIDYLLAYYGIVEMACFFGLLTEEDLVDEFRRATIRRLEQPWLRRYYEVNYPLLLPQMLLHRLRDRSALQADIEDLDADELFDDVRQVGVLFDTGDKEVDAFLWMLDGGEKGGKNITDLLALLESPRQLKAALASLQRDAPRRKGGHRKPHLRGLDLALSGLLDFLEFASSYDSILQRLAQSAVAQSVVWHHHGYWFKALAYSAGAGLGNALLNLSVSGQLDGPEDVAGISVALTRLMSGRYAYTLEEVAASIRISSTGYDSISAAYRELDLETVERLRLSWNMFSEKNLLELSSVEHIRKEPRTTPQLPPAASDDEKDDRGNPEKS